jgi:Arc/MetJ family transcription regulator
MKTTVDIPEEMLREAMRHSGAATKKEAVRLAIEEYNRRKRMAHLADCLGRFENFVSQDELEQMRESDEGGRRDPD